MSKKKKQTNKKNTPLQLYFILLKLKSTMRYFKTQLFLCTSFSWCLKKCLYVLWRAYFCDCFLPDVAARVWAGPSLWGAQEHGLPPLQNRRQPPERPASTQLPPPSHRSFDLPLRSREAKKTNKHLYEMLQGRLQWPVTVSIAAAVSPSRSVQLALTKGFLWSLFSSSTSATGEAA